MKFEVGDELAISEACDCHGHRIAARRRADGTVETAVVSEDITQVTGDELITLERTGPLGRVRVQEKIAFTARTPPSNAAYRNGWEMTFGRSRGPN